MAKYNFYFSFSKSVMLFWILLLVFCSCNNNNRLVKEVQALSGREISFPKGYSSLSYNNSLPIDSLLAKDIKMVSYIDDLHCTSCGVKMLHTWIKQVKQIDPEVAYVIVVQTPQKDVLFNSIDSMRLPCPLMYYDDSVFGEVNKLDVLARNKTFLLDKKNRIVVVGEPFGNVRLSQLYKKAIASLKKEYTQEI